MGKCQRLWAPPVFQNFIPEQVQNIEELVKYLEKLCCHPGNFRETKISAKCWAIAETFQALFDHIRCPQGEKKVSGLDNKSTACSYPCHRHCSWTREPACAPIHTWRNGTIAFSEGELSRATTRTWGRGRKGGNHSIPIPEWAAGYAKYFSC